VSTAHGVTLGEGIFFDRYTFRDFPFAMPDVALDDMVFVAFGVRTSITIPFLGVSSAPLDFDELGTVSIPLKNLLESHQPVQVCIPIVPKGESLRQVVCVSMSFRGIEMMACKSYHDDIAHLHCSLNPRLTPRSSKCIVDGVDSEPDFCSIQEAACTEDLAEERIGNASMQDVVPVCGELTTAYVFHRTFVDVPRLDQIQHQSTSALSVRRSTW
jgi:hypothetical protein